jgi:predicted DCC family thiol-disulfide oxidoreductase YuxK
LAWSLFMPLGARFSIDNVRRSLKTRPETSPEDLNVRRPPERTFTSIAVFGMILQIAVMHLSAALRQDGPTWADGSALYFALHQNLFTTSAGTWLVEHASPDWIGRLTFGFRATEIAIGVLVLLPMWYARRLAFALLLAFHLISRVLWNVGPYEWVMLAGAPVLLTSRDWDAFVRWYTRRKPALTVYFDVDCGICFAISRLLQRLDPLGRLTFVANSSDTAPAEVKAVSEETVAVRDEAAGKTFTKSRAFASILASLPLGTPFGLALRLPGVSHLADRVYDRVAKNRAAISVWFGFDACGVHAESSPPIPPAPEPIEELQRGLAVSREVLAALFLVVSGIALATRMNDETKPQGLEASVYSIVAYPRLFQDWKLFAPDPPKRQVALVVDAQTGRGTKLDPLTGLPPLEMLDPKKPDPRSRPVPLMASYFTSISQPSRMIYVDELRNYIQRLGDQRDLGDKIVWFNVNWFEVPIPSPTASTPSPTQMAEIIPVRRITSRP